MDRPDEVSELRAEVARLEQRVRALEAGRVPASPRSSWNYGLTAVNRVGAFTLAIGLIFFFRYAVDLEWIGAAGRVSGGVVFGLALIGAAEWIGRRGQHSFAQGIAGCGVAALYISLYAGFGYYKLLPEGAAFFGLVGVCAVAVALSFRYMNPAIAALGFLGGLLTPILLHGATPGGWPDLGYLLLLDVTCIWIAMRRDWAELIPLIGAAALGAAWFLVRDDAGTNFVVLAFELAGVHWIATMRRDAARAGNFLYLTGSGCFAAGALRAVGVWTERNVAAADRGSVTSELDSVFLAVYGIASLAYGLGRGSAVNRVLAQFLLGLVIAKLYLWDVWFLQRFYRTTAFVGLGVLLLTASWIYSRSKT